MFILGIISATAAGMAIYLGTGSVVLGGLTSMVIGGFLGYVSRS